MERFWERGEVEDVDMDENGMGWSPYLRVKAWLNITKPLIWENLIFVDDSPYLDPFKIQKAFKFLL